MSVKIVKKLLKFAVRTIKLASTELQTALFEVADLCNQRPVGLSMGISGGLFFGVAGHFLSYFFLTLVTQTIHLSDYVLKKVDKWGLSCARLNKHSTVVQLVLK